MITSGRLSFAGIEPGVLVHALYHGTKALGPYAKVNDRPKLSLAEAEAMMEYRADPTDHTDQGRYVVEWMAGRPLKIDLDLNTKTFDPTWYDRDAGDGRAAEVLQKLRSGR